MLASIAHRASGVALYVGVLGLAKWLVLAAIGGDLFALYDSILRGPVGQIGIYLVVAAFGYHLCNGLRHLFWDVGQGFKPKVANLTAWAALLIGAVGAPLALYVFMSAAP